MSGILYSVAILRQSVDRLRSTQRSPRRAWASPRPQVAGHPFNTVQVHETRSSQSLSFDLRSKSCRMR